VNCGIQKRFRLGSLPITKSSIHGTACAIEAAYAANWYCASRVRGVVRWSRW